MIVSFVGIISGNTNLGAIPTPSESYLPILFRNQTNGDFATFYLQGNIINIYKAQGYTAGDTYTGYFIYISAT